jgi:poly(3-hydroxybutyrate) depolymerase
MNRLIVAPAVVLAWLAVPGAAGAPRPTPVQTQAVVAMDETVAPGANFDKAEFRFWRPQGEQRVRALVVLVPGSNGDGRPMADSPFWQAFATRHQLALVACRFTDKPHDQPFIEEYVEVSRGSGQALLSALTAFATRSGHAEVATVPLFLWGMSAGGQFNYEFAAWKPERVAAFVVNKGGIYYSALVPKATRGIPALLFAGDADLAFRTDTIVGLFAVNRRAGALWALTPEPGAAHVVGQSQDLGALFFEELLPMRVGPAGLLPIAAGAGFVGNLQEHTFQTAAAAGVPRVPTAWLPTERAARAWQAVVSGAPAVK